MILFLRSRQISVNHTEMQCCFCSFSAPHEIFGPKEMFCTMFRKMCEINKRSHTMEHIYEISQFSCETDGEETIQKICFSFAFWHLHSLCISCMKTPEIICAGLITPIRRGNFLGQGWPLAQE